MGTCALALRETARPDIKQTRSVLMGTVLRLGEVDTQFNEAIEINVKTSKCTAIARPKSWKKFALRANEDGKPIMEPNGKEDEEDEEDEDNKNDISERVTFAQLKARTEYFVDRSEDNDEEDIKIEMDDEDMEAVLKRKKEEEQSLEKVEKEQLVKGFKYGTTFTPCPDGQFPRMPTRKGIDICGFFPALNVRHSYNSCSPSFHLLITPTNCSSGENYQWAKYNIYGLIQYPPNNKSLCLPSCKRWKKKVPWRSLVG